MPGKGVVTNFSQYSLAQLNQMLNQSDPATAQNAAQAWDSTGQLLTEQAQNLQSQLSSIDSAWTGTAATDYKKMMTDLVGGIQKVANTAFTMRDLMYDAADALSTAKAQMPTVADVPTVSPASLTITAAPVVYGEYLPPQLATELAQEQAAAQQAVAVATTAQAKAVAVMQALAGSYVTAQAGIPPSPNGSVPMVPTSSTSASSAATSGAGVSVVAGQSGALITASGTTTSFSMTTTDGQPSTLFGDMFTVGLAAAAAVGGVMGTLAPAAPRPARTSTNGAPGETAPADGQGPAGAGAAEDVGVSVPGPGGDPSQAANLAASNAADTAASGAGSEPMMPMMPMGGPGGPGMGDSGGSRRGPAWLVEHQDVWGTSIPAAPGLIGE
jgi:uncharacterized protein YukE